jgi:hypothetical protein
MTLRVQYRASLQERCDGEEEADEPVEQGAPVAVGEDEPFLDPAHQGGAEDLAQGPLHQQTDGLERVAEDEGGLGVVLGLLEQLLDRRHLTPFFGYLDAVRDQDEP